MKEIIQNGMLKINSNFIKLITADITTLNVDCIVNAANSSLLGGGGVDGAIHYAAGKELYNECLELNGCKTGEAKITKGYNLKAKHIIHTVGPIYSSKKEDSVLLSNCYKSSLNLAKENGIKSIAFPCISTGIYGYPQDEASKIVMKALEEWCNENDSYNMEITICCFDSYSKSFYENFFI